MKREKSIVFVAIFFILVASGLYFYYKSTLKDFTETKENTELASDAENKIGTMGDVAAQEKGIDIFNEYEKFGRDLSLFEGILFNPKLGGPTKESIKIDSLTERFGPDALTINWLKTKITSSGADYYIYEDPGASGDLNFSFYTKEGNGSFTNVGSTAVGLKIPGNGFLYTKSHINEFFTAYRKYRINAKGIVKEVPQQQLHVGLHTKSNKLIPVYKNTLLRDVAFEINKGSDVYVDSFIDTEYVTGRGLFLVKSANGKTGWISSEEAGANVQCVWTENSEMLSSPDAPLPGLCFLGD
jgi:hypothetical protein